MTRRASRYTEVRWYMAGGSLAFLLAAWAALAIHDHTPSDTAGGALQPARSGRQVIPNNGSQSFFQPVPQTRTRGS